MPSQHGASLDERFKVHLYASHSHLLCPNPAESGPSEVLLLLRHTLSSLP